MNENLIEVKNLSFRYPNSEEYNLKNVSVEVKRGEFLVVMGENGAGKTTLCKALCGGLK